MLVHARWLGSNAIIASFSFDFYGTSECRAPECRAPALQRLIHGILKDTSCDYRSLRVTLGDKSLTQQTELTITSYCMGFFGEAGEAMYVNKERLWNHLSRQPSTSEVTVYVSRYCQKYLAALNVCCDWAYVPKRFLALPSNYRADKRVVLAAVTRNGIVLEHVAERYKKDLQVVYAAFKNNTGALRFAHSDVTDNAAFMTKCVQRSGTAYLHTGTALKYASENVKKNKSVVLVAVSDTAFALKYADIDLQNDPKIVLAALQCDPICDAISVIKHMPAAIKDNKEIALAALNRDPEGIEWFSGRLKNDKELALIAVKKQGKALRFFSEHLKNDLDVVLPAINENPFAIKFASINIQLDVKVALQVVKHHGCLLQFLSEEMRDNDEVVYAAVTQDARAYAYASQRLHADKTLTLKAASRFDKTLCYAANELNTDPRVIAVAQASFGKDVLKTCKLQNR